MNPYKTTSFSIPNETRSTVQEYVQSLFAGTGEETLPGLDDQYETGTGRASLSDQDGQLT